jgi:hypothetical protein
MQMKSLNIFKKENLNVNELRNSLAKDIEVKKEVSQVNNYFKSLVEKDELTPVDQKIINILK